MPEIDPIILELRADTAGTLIVTAWKLSQVVDGPNAGKAIAGLLRANADVLEAADV
ncbi:MAG: hypothetical protein ABJO01_10065 [Parasphingorhabdus sp.]|uniref:hypothetical protein n=1 Tax=Parasphingorhabdus sp. TaxID=2709688 RepID=UPI003297DC41